MVSEHWGKKVYLYPRRAERRLVQTELRIISIKDGSGVGGLGFVFF